MVRNRKQLAFGLIGLLVVWLIVAYLVMPAAWRRYVHRHPQLDDVPNITQTANGIPGDPLNVLLIGNEAELKQAMQAAGWFEADPLGMRSDLAIAADTVLDRPDDRAPVSNLYLFGRKEDLAFQQPVGDSPRHRHHVRFWKCKQPTADGWPRWIGSAVYDKGVGFSHTTGQITHHTAADVDAERDYLFADLNRTGGLSDSYFVDGFHQVLEGKNGGGDPWRTDGRLEAGILTEAKTP